MFVIFFTGEQINKFNIFAWNDIKKYNYALSTAFKTMKMSEISNEILGNKK